MKSHRLIHISFFITLLFTGILVHGQERGSVSVHSDPRLSLLVNKTKAPELNKPIANATVTPRTAKIKTPRTVAPADIKENKDTKAVKETATGKGSREEAVKATPPVKAIDTKTTVAPAKPTVVKNAEPAKGKEIKAVRKTFLTESRGPHYTGPGFRVQIYNGPDRAKALRVKSEFMSHNPGVHTYLIYASPCYKVKAGDFRKRNEAEGMYKDANSLFSPCMIVPDEVSIKSN